MNPEWHQTQHDVRATVDDALLTYSGGAPHWFCYRDGVYLGTEKDTEAAKQRCQRGKVGDYVMELETTEAAHKRLKPKVKLKWESSGKDEWQSVVDGENLPARIRMLDKKSFACYRAGKYLGMEGSRASAEMRVAIGEISHKNAVMTLWEQQHPSELPPFLQLTEAERAEYWRLNPPKAGATPARVTNRGAAPKPNEDPATAKLRAELTAASGNRAPGAKRARADAACAYAP